MTDLISTFPTTKARIFTQKARVAPAAGPLRGVSINKPYSARIKFFKEAHHRSTGFFCP